MGNSEEYTSTIDSLYWRIAVSDDQEAFRTLFYQFFAPLCVFAHRYIDDRSTCEDIVQETFLKLWKNRKNQEINISLRNFLVSNVKNNCIDHLRKKDLFLRYADKQKQKYIFSSQNFEEIHATSELEQLIENAINKLPSHIKEVFEKNRFEGMSYREIAEENQISIKTVESYMSKALKSLREDLKDYLPFLYLFL